MAKQGMISDLTALLASLEGRIYKNYKKILGSWSCREWTLFIDHVQSSCESSPSRMRMRVPQLTAGFPLKVISTKDASVALGDYLLRKWESFSKKVSRRAGSGKSGLFYAEPCGPEILERSSVYFDPRFVELRFRYGLPSVGNRIAPENLIQALSHAFPKIVSRILTWTSLDETEVMNFIHCYQDQEALRGEIMKKGYVAFIPDDAVLPRIDSNNPHPLPEAVRFISPPSLRQTFLLPHKGPISGMALPQGVTVITGGGFHGKTTLLNAVKTGIYNHVPGDGREYIVSDVSLFKINTEEGRTANGIDISPYIHDLPFGKGSTFFSSTQCSGSTSQAASVVESIRMGCRLLLFDEDSSAANFMYCDPVMDSLIGEKNRTITPFLETVRDLWESFRVSSIMVTGSSSYYLQTADKVLKMSDYRIEDATEEAQKSIRNQPQVLSKKLLASSFTSPRWIDSDRFRIRKRKAPFQTRVLSPREIQIGSMIVDFSDNEQICDMGQVRTIHTLILKFEEHVFKKRISFEKAVLQLFDSFFIKGIHDFLSEEGGFVPIRPIDFAHVMNRLRLLQIRE